MTRNSQKELEEFQRIVELLDTLPHKGNLADTQSIERYTYQELYQLFSTARDLFQQAVDMYAGLMREDVKNEDSD